MAASLLLAVLASPLGAQQIGTINFDFDSDRLDAEAQAEIARIADRLDAAPDARPTVVIGFTDAVGGSGYNQGLGLRRAREVARALVAAGVPVSRIGTVSSRGESELLVAVAGPERQNRRVLVSLDDMLAACRSFHKVTLPATDAAVLRQDLRRRLDVAAREAARFAASGRRGPAFQMAGAAVEDCGAAVGFADGSLGREEYAKRCLCNAARLQVALDAG